MNKTLHETQYKKYALVGTSCVGKTTLLSKIEQLLKEKYPEKGITKEDLQELHKAQVSSLETVDKKINTLIDKLPKPIQLVITGDHGECFGENMNWGHGYPNKKVMEVPLLIASIN